MLKRKPTTTRGKRFLKNRDPKVIENTKKAMFIKSPSTSQTMGYILGDLFDLKKPDSVWYRKKESNRISPFEDLSSLEFYSDRSDASLFMLGSHTKKRPNNLVMGRLFNWSLLDMVEFGVTNYKQISEFKASCQRLGSKPMFAITGDLFETDLTYKTIANMFVDYFRGRALDKLNIQGLEHVISLTINRDMIHFSHFSVKFKRSGTHIPIVHLEEIGPSMDLTIRRTRLATNDLRKEAIKTPECLKPKKVKNVKSDGLRSKIGQVYLKNQVMTNIMSKKSKGLKRRAPVVASKNNKLKIQKRS